MDNNPLSFTQIAEFYDAFKMFDKNGDNSIVPMELMEIMKAFGEKRAGSKTSKSKEKPLDIKYIKELFTEVEVDGNEEIDFPEFLALMTSKKNVELKKDMKKIFTVIDQNKDGFIDHAELKNFLRQIGEQKCPDALLDRICKHMIRIADADLDGKLNEKEFESQVTNIYKTLFEGKKK